MKSAPDGSASLGTGIGTATPKTEISLGLLFGLAANVAAAAVLLFACHATSRTWLITIGTVDEFVGVLLVASGEILPRLGMLATRIAESSRPTLRKLEAFLRRVFRRRSAAGDEHRGHKDGKVPHRAAIISAEAPPSGGNARPERRLRLHTRRFSLAQ
jgi:hypothetical protein